MIQFLPSVRAALEWVLDAVAPPALFIVWQDDLGDLAIVLEACRAAHKPYCVVENAGRGNLLSLVQEQQGPAAVVVSPGGLSTVPAAARPQVNLARNRLLLPNRTVVFIEPISQQSALRRDFPDVFAVVRSNFYLNRPTYEDDYLWNTGEAGRLATIAASLPPLFSAGSILVDHGVPQFKGSPVKNCPRCGGILHRGPTTLTFRYAPDETQTQPVEGWVCSCGERYVPGQIARAAHRKAFGCNA